MSNVWIIAEKPESYGALCSLARQLGERVEAVVIGPKSAADEAASCGADEVKWVSLGEDALYESGFGAVAEAMSGGKPDIVLCAVSRRVRLLAARIAAAAKTRVIPDAISLRMDEGSLVAERMVYGGVACCTERVTGETAVVLVSESVLAAQEAASSSDAAPVSELSCSGEMLGVTLVERSPREVESVNLASARRVVSVGRGVEKQEDLQIIEALAQAIGAEMGCTRPIAEGVGWMSRERYIGVSGAMLKPDLFLAIGVSGQIQHMVGGNGAKTVIAINKDKNAPVFKQADYGIVGDLYEVVPQLAELLK